MRGNVIDQHAELYFYNAKTPVTAIGHIIWILNQTVFILTLLCCVFGGETVNVFGLTWLGLEYTIYFTRGEHANNYTSVAAFESFYWLQTFPNMNLICYMYASLNDFQN
jgi:hypothetical protein